MSMNLRYLFRQHVTLTSVLSYGHLGSSSRHVGQTLYSTLVRRSLVSRGHPGLTFCQWRYLRLHFGARTGVIQFVNSHQWSTGKAKCTQSEHSESVADVLERYHTLLDRNSFHPECVTQFTTALRSAVYSNLHSLPWLHNDNHVIAFMQILMNGKIEDLLRKPLYDQEHFHSICQQIEQLSDLIPGHDCPSVLLSLLYSGVDRTEPVVHKLLARCHDAAPDLSVHQLRDLTHILQTLGGRDFHLAEKILSRLDELLSRDIKEVEFEVRDVCVSNPILAVYMSQDLLEKMAHAVLAKLHQQSPHIDAFTVGCIFRYARKMKFRVSSETLAKIRSVGKASLENLDDCSHLQSYHIAEICHNAKNLGCFSGEIVQKVQARSLELLRSKDLHIRDVTNLLFAFSKTTDASMKEEASQLLMDHLDDADVLTLSNIADNILDLDLYDPDLISVFQSKVMQNIHNISQYITRLVKILRLLRERRDCNQRFNQKLCSFLLKNLTSHHGYDPTLVVVVAQFLLPSVRTIVPAVLMESLLYAIPRCNLSLMLMVLQSLDKIGSPRSRSLHNQMLELRLCIQQNIGRQIYSATRAGQLADLVKALHIKSRNRDFALLDHIMDHYPSLTPSMSRPDYHRTLFVFRRMPHPYYHPQVFEDLIAFTMDNYSQLNCTAVLDLVTILANAGYRPKHFEDFSNFTTQVLKEVMSTKDYLSQISLAHNLSVMGIFPYQILGQIFTFDYLEKVDSSIEEEEAGRNLVRNLMMQLNRSVILECPHLDVPWFHQHYCQEMVKTSAARDFQKNLVMIEEVEGALLEALSGREGVARRVYSPYFHPIDFEVVLDASGQPVSSAAVKLLQPEELGYQRVALMLLSNQQLCTNSVQRRGQYLRDRRHLEILGYRVEEISRHDWNSMALREWGARVEFVRNKIFHDNSSNKGHLIGSASEMTSQHS
ncbi:FAST kinase domain-containing protein 1, mitochondrial-like [Babylonia areolata]|uniref:FAST kinase domain-containing protein 1, mitochondrial-like n=1 Tax=Babylonia areolata TaxID=304850 RepID=UPI003FD3D69D